LARSLSFEVKIHNGPPSSSSIRAVIGCMPPPGSPSMPSMIVRSLFSSFQKRSRISVSFATGSISFRFAGTTAPPARGFPLTTLAIRIILVTAAVMAVDDQTRVQPDLMDQRFQLLVNAVTDYAIYMLEPDGTVASWNPGARRFKGYEADEILGRNFSCFFTEEDRAAGLPQLALDTAAREGRFEAEGVRLRKDGSRFWVSAVIDPIRDEAGNLLGFAKITRDITERRAAQEELEHARAQLFQAQKLQALGELTGGIAHDFNNLLTVIRGSAELLRTEGLTEAKRRRYLDAIIETADRATNLTSHLLAFGRRQPLKPEVVDLNLRLDAFVEMVSRTIGSKVEIV